MSNRAAQACDGCRVRKVKCNSTQPCSQCSHLGLGCIYSPSTKRKPSVRNRLVTQLRNKSNIAASGHGLNIAASPSDYPERPGPSVTSIAGIVNPDQDGVASAGIAAIAIAAAGAAGNGGYALGTGMGVGAGVGVGAETPPPPPAWDARTFTTGFFIGMLAKYEEQVYPGSPIITSYEVRQSIGSMHADLDDAAFVYAVGAVTIHLTTPTVQGETGAKMTELIRLSLSAYRRAQTMVDDVHNARPMDVRTTFRRIMTCVFLAVAMMAFGRLDRCFAMLREALTMVQMIQVQQCSHSAVPLEPRDVPKFHRIYWQVFIHERFLTILAGYPSIMTPLPTGLPARDPAIPAHIDVGFNRLIRLFQLLDGPLLLYWSAQQNPAQPVAGVTLQWIEGKQAQLDQDEAGASEAEQGLIDSGRGTFTELQHVDLLVTRLWMRSLLWQYGLMHRLFRSAPQREDLAIHLQVYRLSAQLRSLVSQLESISTVVTYGIGLVHKVFEITSTMADVLALPLSYGQTEEDVRRRIHDFVFLVRFLFSFERAEREQRDYLRERLDGLQQQYTIVNFADMVGLNPMVHGAYH
ncbi:hypothetical protein TGAMA5MH_08782 [Trichoderma gamsii]|uniref:Zn(2)-C6 fungal-type domain-containing protein n=1 Tax=Trichoderma gamsii TaxID=398673 RepID=A0A2K0T1G1_9HYPO|nr:hypothetical protein TGAMA5MH_08782 [Trichoderma gamsii]